MALTNRAERRVEALASQIYAAGKFVPCFCGDPGCLMKATRRSVADKIIKGQWRTLRLTDDVVRLALSKVSIIND